MSLATTEHDLQMGSNEAAFEAWARVYDANANPLLSLEERYLDRLLPAVDGRKIVDLGCGTGRWLLRLSRRGTPRSLCGIDASDEMLAIARDKTRSGAKLHHARLPALPVENASTDLALCSFTLSYVQEIYDFARELARVLTVGADLFITDMHPGTAVALGWQRAFSNQREVFELKSLHRPIEEVALAMQSVGHRLVGAYQPAFGPPELPVFLSHGKRDAYDRAEGRPAIYLLHFKRGAKLDDRADVALRHAHCVLGRAEAVSADTAWQGKNIHSVGQASTRTTSIESIDLSGFTLFPGLVNPHDHLDFALFPRLGVPPYGNASEWACDIQERFRDTIQRQRAVPLDIRLWWGAIRNVLCGVTTVCHHNPFQAVFRHKNFPVKVLSEFAWAHSLDFDDALVQAHSQGDQTRPFILHAGEGIDEHADQEFLQLLQIGLIDARSVLVHGLAMQQTEYEILNSLGGSVIRCPSSNQFLFGATPSSETDRVIANLAIGSDSPLTATGDLLDEIAFCHKELRYPADDLFRYVFEGGPAVLRLKQGEGRIAPGGCADLFAVRLRDMTPAEHLVSLTWRDIELVVVDGVIRLASAEMLCRVPEHLRPELQCLSVDGVQRWLHAPVHDLFRSSAQVLGHRGVSLNGRQLSVMEA